MTPMEQNTEETQQGEGLPAELVLIEMRERLGELEFDLSCARAMNKKYVRDIAELRDTVDKLAAMIPSEEPEVEAANTELSSKSSKGQGRSQKAQ